MKAVLVGNEDPIKALKEKALAGTLSNAQAAQLKTQHYRDRLFRSRYDHYVRNVGREAARFYAGALVILSRLPGDSVEA